jgi:hypothetical protein
LSRIDGGGVLTSYEWIAAEFFATDYADCADSMFANVFATDFADCTDSLFANVVRPGLILSGMSIF